MDAQSPPPSRGIALYQIEDAEQDEQIICYYAALLQSIRDGVEDPELIDEDDIEAAFLENQWENTEAKNPNGT